MNALIFVVDALLTLAVYAFLLRLLLQLARADFRNPLAQAVLGLTNWLVLPLRRVLPPLGRLDSASLVAVLAAQAVATSAVFLLATGQLMPAGALLRTVLRAAAHAAINLYTFALILYALLSFVAPGAYSPATALLESLCEPVLRPLRRFLPIVGGLDFSPLLAIIALQAIRILMR